MQHSLNDLQDSITKLGTLVGWSIGKIGLSTKLSKLVFENCYFGSIGRARDFQLGAIVPVKVWIISCLPEKLIC